MERYLRQRLGSSKFDGVDPVRSKMMSSIRGKGNKSTEVALRMALVTRGVRGWKVHHPGILGSPDLYFPQAKLAIFVDGCFWHGCGKCGHTPKTRSAFWTAKLERNRARDLRNTKLLTKSGYTVQRIWEHELKSQSQRSQVVKNIEALIKRQPRSECR